MNIGLGGAKFTKWRAVIKIGEGLPTAENILEDAQRMAEYARLSQEVGLVPIIEPEVLMDGAHSLDRVAEVTEQVLEVVFKEIDKFDIELSGLILKINMVVPGKESGEKMVPEVVAEETVRVLKATVPEGVPGIVFLSGGQNTERATDNLQAIALLGPQKWELTFSYARALQGPALEIWRGRDENLEKAQAVFLDDLKDVAAAREGQYRYSAE